MAFLSLICSFGIYSSILLLVNPSTKYLVISLAVLSLSLSPLCHSDLHYTYLPEDKTQRKFTIQEHFYDDCNFSNNLVQGGASGLTRSLVPMRCAQPLALAIVSSGFLSALCPTSLSPTEMERQTEAGSRLPLDSDRNRSRGSEGQDQVSDDYM